MKEERENSLANAGIALFSAQILSSAAMFVLLCSLFFQMGDDPFYRSAFIPSYSTAWTVGSLVLLTVCDFLFTSFAVSGIVYSQPEGLGSFFVAKFLILILYLIVFGCSTAWTGTEIFFSLFYLVYSIAEMYIAIALHSELLRGNKEEDDDKPYQSPGHTGKYVSRFV
ncbi:hypothetical protein GUITHDRAFT_108115 [Guillardia theta CCMP2712]|uniref:MARVEL domain-containing protein n=2 Tax=Guillardia theta TaxID=55529 RepID=L1JD85_GUITC|nr:hypothetical protein GUITHDRAFT_108115 [Guillardia theta CCMP2712]EKX46079.1 hypothetical protein GUITHDRAFT_108115 [Guillardia theta CCMP2712]|eukprot:XP_005833059.1 hypothetical protein GUITHDRAFT_108115 [Guillardia theta CCMP2712]